MSPLSIGPGSQDAETLSSEVLAELRLIGGDDLVGELMAVFTERTPERLRSVEESLAAGDLEGSAAALHSLRSASGSVGARRLADMAGSLERAARGGDADELATGLPQLQVETEKVLRAARRLATAAG